MGIHYPKSIQNLYQCGSCPAAPPMAPPQPHLRRALHHLHATGALPTGPYKRVPDLTVWAIMCTSASLSSTVAATGALTFVLTVAVTAAPTVALAVILAVAPTAGADCCTDCRSDCCTGCHIGCCTDCYTDCCTDCCTDCRSDCCTGFHRLSQRLLH